MAYSAWWAFWSFWTHVDSSYGLVHNEIVLYLWMVGSLLLAHLWLLYVGVALFVTRRRRGWLFRSLQIPGAVIVALLFVFYLSVTFS